MATTALVAMMMMMMGGMALSAAVLLMNSRPSRRTTVRGTTTRGTTTRGTTTRGTAAGVDDLCRAGVLEMHNKLRAKHGRPPLAWDDRLAASAQRKAETCVFEHLGDSLDGKPLGENLAWATPRNFSCTNAIQGMYATEEKPKGDDPLLPGGGYNHVTQILYPKATKVGCGRAMCPQYGSFVSCHYDVPNGF